VISALIRAEQNPAVVDWMREIQDEAVFMTSTTISELVYGVMKMPDGRRKVLYDDNVAAILSVFYDRTIDFEANAAIEYGRFVPDREAIGRPISRPDAQIAACCLATGATLATRNVKDFEDIPGLEVINPRELDV
jgi:predicted nucleic acid-binding protein